MSGHLHQQVLKVPKKDASLRRVSGPLLKPLHQNPLSRDANLTFYEVLLGPRQFGEPAHGEPPSR
jgi:hypothetical protein